MVIVDSSVWIEFFRGRDATIVEHVGHLLDADQVGLPAPVRIEILAGTPTAELARLRRLLSALPLLVPGEATWAKLETWLVPARTAGQRFGAMDLLIAGIADDHGASLWSKDRDFNRMADLGFVQLYEP